MPRGERYAQRPQQTTCCCRRRRLTDPVPRGVLVAPARTYLCLAPWRQGLARGASVHPGSVLSVFGSPEAAGVVTLAQKCPGNTAVVHG